MYEESETADVCPRLYARSQLPCNDTGNGDRFIEMFGDVFKFVPNHGWLHFNGARWRSSGARDDAAEAAKIVAASIMDECEIVGRSSERQAWANRSLSQNGLRNMVANARTKLRVDASLLDKDLHALGTPNGVLKFDVRRATCDLVPARAEQMITKQVSAPYDASATAPLWEAHLARVQPDLETRLYLQRALGYSLLGHTKEQQCFFHVGAGGDGKSTTMNTVAYVMGDYAQAIDVNLILARRTVKDADAPRAALASLSGDIRFVLASEPPSTAKLNESLIKQLTGGAPIRARYNYKDLFEFTPRCKIFLECNSLPMIVGHDDGIWRRIRVVPWTVQIPKAEIDADLEEKLRAEGPGILKWLVDGALMYLRDSLKEPQAVRAARDQYKKSSNSALGWIEEAVEFRGNFQSDEKALWAHYKLYCADRGLRAVTRKSLLEQLGRHGVYRAEAKHGRTRRVMVTGCRLVEAAAAMTI